MEEATQVLQGGLEPVGQGLRGSWFREHGLEWKEWEQALGGREPLSL